MKIAFYAPLKAPDDPTPSGDRAMARLLIAALGVSGHDVVLASRFRSFDAAGDAARQERLRSLGLRLAARLVRRYLAEAGTRRPELWFTYHLYHKAPDWLGPTVSRALGIPYVVAEASHAPKQAEGRWALGWRSAKAAIAQAELVVGLNPADARCVRPLLASPARWLPLRPFVDVARLRRAAAAVPQQLVVNAGRNAWANDGSRAAPLLLTVAMMRAGDKLASYRLLATALGAVVHHPWCLLVAGDGPARAEVMAALAPLGHRVQLVGRCEPPALYGLYAAADLYVWPAIGEAYGMAMLEAQALGLPVVAGAAGGVGTIVRHQRTGLLTPVGDAALFARALAELLCDADRRHAMAEAAWQAAEREHDIAVAAGTLATALHRLVVTREKR